MRKLIREKAGSMESEWEREEEVEMRWLETMRGSIGSSRNKGTRRRKQFETGDFSSNSS